MADAHFEIPRLAEIYDALDPDRSDLAVYRAIAQELDAQAVLDVGCGTGTFACMLAGEGTRVIGLDPAAASLEVARKKPGADRVTWVHGDAGALAALEIEVDLVTMTGNVAQVFVSDDEWSKTLGACHGALRPGGHLVFESRVPEDEAWRRWTRDATYKRTTLRHAVKTGTPGTAATAETVEYWVEVTEARHGFVSFRSTYIFESDGATYESDSTLRFRSRSELTSSLEAQGFEVAEVRDAPDRPGREHVFLARRVMSRSSFATGHQ
jgi:ubiquinone/menaquinone biosynthesis C-methylase UbiE